MKKGFLRFLFVISFLTVFMMFPKSAFALTFKVEKSVDTLKPNKEVTVYIKVSDVGSDSLRKYNVTLGYDANILDFKSGSSDVARIQPANPVVITNLVDDKNEPSGTISGDTTLATIVFSAKKAGDANLTLNSSDCYTISGLDENKEIKATNTSSMVKVVSFSSDATLSSLKIPNATISPKFDKNTLEYSTTIQDITEITVNAIPTDSNSKILISDNYKNLQKGENVVKISVTAEDGTTTKTYSVKVNLKMTPTEEELKKANASLKNLEVKGYNIDFSKEVKKYTLTVPYKITKLEVKAEAENEKATVITQGNSNLKVGRNTVKVQVTSEDEKNKEDYTITVTRQEEEKEVVQTCPDTTSTNEWIMFSICMFVTFTLGIILGYFLCKKEVLRKLFRRKKLKEEIEERLSDTIEIPNNDQK